jgi:hypothetical protein
MGTMLKRTALAGAFGVALLWAGGALAQADEDIRPRDERGMPADMPNTEPRMSEPVQSSSDRKDSDREILRFGLLGGVEGYAGGLSDQVNPGPLWGASVAVQPFSWMGAELGYSGAVNEIDGRIAPGADHGINGADIIRNGGAVALTFNAPTRGVQPYAVGGIGVDRYTVRATDAAAGLSDDTVGRVPLGAGVRTHVGPFAADARFQMNPLFSQGFASTATNEDAPGVGYSAQLQLGGRF